MSTDAVRLLIVTVALALAGVTGYDTGHARAKASGDAEISRLKADHASSRAAAAEAATLGLSAAQARGDALETRLARTETTRQSQALEHFREIKRLTTGRPCLDAGAVRLLSDTPNEPARTADPAPVPAAPGGAHAADATFATDTDVVVWIDAARRQYGTCRDRLDALIDWHMEPPQ